MVGERENFPMQDFSAGGAAGQHPETAPAQGRARQDHGVAMEDELVALGRSDLRCAPAFAWQFLRRCRTAERSDRANFAFWISRRANERTEIHHRILKCARLAAWNESGREVPKFFVACASVDRFLQILQAREHAGGICFDQRQRLPESKYRDGGGGVSTQARQLAERSEIGRNLPTELGDNDLGAAMQIAGTIVIAEALPGVQDVILGRARQRFDRRKTPQPRFVTWLDRSDSGLLQHDFRNEHSVGIAGAPPRQGAPSLFRPSKESPPVRCEGFKLARVRGALHLYGRVNSFTAPLNFGQSERLRALLTERGFKFSPKPYTIFFAQKEKLSIAVYEKGPKVLLQGRGVEDFVKFELEPNILGEARLGYEEVHSPEMFAPHFGVDESGKGDFFGPLVIAGVYVEHASARRLLDAGVQDSKRIGSDARIYTLATEIRAIVGDGHDVVAIGPARYNQLYRKFANLNSLLGWGHARVIENLLARRPDCPRSLSDKFADSRVIEKALLEHGQKIEIEQRTKAESDIAVAAASILAREAFIRWLERKGKELGVKLGRGVSAAIKKTAAQIAGKGGGPLLEEVAKTHFRTAHEAAPDFFPAPPPKRAWIRR